MSESKLILPGKKATHWEREEVQTNTEEIRKSKGLLVRAANLHVPDGYVTVGVAAVFYFRLNAADSHTYAFGAMSDLGNMAEGQASMGMKKLSEHLMVQYGRTPPRKRG